MVASLTAKTANFTSLENYCVYGIYHSKPIFQLSINTVIKQSFIDLNFHGFYHLEESHKKLVIISVTIVTIVLLASALGKYSYTKPPHVVELQKQTFPNLWYCW